MKSHNSLGWHGAASIEDLILSHRAPKLVRARSGPFYDRRVIDDTGRNERVTRTRVDSHLADATGQWRSSMTRLRMIASPDTTAE